MAKITQGDYSPANSHPPVPYMETILSAEHREHIERLERRQRKARVTLLRSRMKLLRMLDQHLSQSMVDRDAVEQIARTLQHLSNVYL